MTGVLAALDDTPAAGSVLAAARQLAELLGVPCRAIHVQADRDTPSSVIVDLHGIELRVVIGDATGEIVRALEDPTVSIAVVGSRSRVDGSRPAGHIATAIMEHATKPVVVVPPDGGVVRPLQRILVPLEGSTTSSESIVGPLGRLAEAGATAVALHVFDATTAPLFWDDVAHSRDCYADEFMSRWWSGPTMPEVRLRRGDPALALLDVAARDDVDLIVLGWGQDLSGGHARVVRTVLANATVPVLLVPDCC